LLLSLQNRHVFNEHIVIIMVESCIIQLIGVVADNLAEDGRRQQESKAPKLNREEHQGGRGNNVHLWNERVHVAEVFDVYPNGTKLHASV